MHVRRWYRIQCANWLSPHIKNIAFALCVPSRPDLCVYNAAYCRILAKKGHIMPWAGSGEGGGVTSHHQHSVASEKRNGNESTCVGPRSGVLPQLGECLR